MNHIIMQAMALIIQEVILIEQYSIDDEENLLPRYNSFSCFILQNF